MTLHQLRLLIGDDPFWQLLRTWVQSHANGNATIPQFIELAERISGQDLTEFFQSWLYSPSKPALPAASMIVDPGTADRSVAGSQLSVPAAAKGILAGNQVWHR